MRIARAGTLGVVLVVLAAACSGAEPGRGGPSVAPLEPYVPANSGPVDEVTVDGIVAHLRALQAIADANGGTRVAGSTGYDASARYVADVLRATGYEVTLPSTEVPVFEQDATSVLVQIEPVRRRWVDGRDFRAMLFSASGAVRATVSHVDGGCTAADYAGFPSGDVALIQSTPECFRRLQVVNAQQAGAVAVIGRSTAERGFPLRPTLVDPGAIAVPVLSVTAQAGRALVDGSVVRIRTRVSTSFDDVRSVVAELPDVEGDHVLMLGGHLDSVMDGPGLNDNGSGTALLLETARWAAGLDPAPALRFAFWAGEEAGLYGSWAYAHALGTEERERIDAYLNLDMVGSPNFVTFVYEASAGDPEMSRRVADRFEEALEELGAASEPLDLHGASDHAAFDDVGIATGGLYTGSQELKTPEQAEAYGGTAGEKLDPCYHQPCDTIDNVSEAALRLHASALVDVLISLLG
ncbi:MAG: M20/M25/M40 family metallo-hydrolase [Actinomycetota bacterium]